MVSGAHDQPWDTATPPRATSVVRRISWLGAWGIATASVVGLVASYGFGGGGLGPGAVMIATATGFFILPDLTFIIGARDPHEQGRLPMRTVPSYNAMHRIWAPLALTVLGGWLMVGSSTPSTVGVVALIGGLSWIAHVAIDRAAGFGLRNADGSL